MGKKKCEVLDVEFVGFEVGMVECGFLFVLIKVLWDVFVLFLDYVFNKVYSVVYGLVLYWMVYLKVYYLVEYMVVVLISVCDDKDKLVLYFGECWRMGIKVFLLDVNEFVVNFVVVGIDIWFGFVVICNVGVNVVEVIVVMCE